jgi:hypothetical protein
MRQKQYPFPYPWILMPKRQRRSTRERRAATASARPAAHDRPTAAVATGTRRAYSGSQRAGSLVRPGAARAAGEPSPVLEQEAARERSFVVKDFRRIAIVVAVMAVLLVLSDIAVNALLP